MYSFEREAGRQYGEVSQVLETLAERFQATRLALNDISDRLFSLGDPPGPWDALLQFSTPPQLQIPTIQLLT